MKNILFVLIITFSLTACETINYKTTISQRLDTFITAGIGDTIYKSTTEKSLPNAFGRADIFGRTTPVATTIVIFEGLKDENAVFLRKTTDIDTGATTMNMSPIIVPNSATTTTNGNIGSTPVYSRTTTEGPPVILPPQTPNAKYMDRNANIINVNIKKLPANFIIEGVDIRIEAVGENSIKYMVTKNIYN